jgi:Tol biopolymer transport system component
MAANGEGGITLLTPGDTTDLWPSVDSDPRPRLYYEALVDSRPDPRLYMTQLGTTLRTDLTMSGGEQPRVSPKADSVLFTLPNPKTGKREIFKMSDRGGPAANLSGLPDYESFDPAWSKDGNRVAFVSDRGADADNHHNFDIWVMDMRHPDKPTRVTTNGSWDDSPAFDPAGRYIYFRSNRGGAWGIWRIALK